ncbi:MAG: hypothetical protein IKN54_03860 [Lachnospiraceae bacterium]|nr:hypothetical protein [Lachnospiraceae bacterium]
MKKKVCFILNLSIIVFAVIANILTFTGTYSGTGLTSSGFSNFKYFTVLSNEFCGLVAIAKLLFDIKHKDFPLIYKLLAASTVGLTFLTIAAFLGPIYGHASLYKGANLYFHLIIPLIAMFEYILLDSSNSFVPFKQTFITVLPVLIYGIIYLANIFINGKGQRPNSNDWYGFLNWGLFAGIIIFIVLVFSTWCMACILRLLNQLLTSRK